MTQKRFLFAALIAAPVMAILLMPGGTIQASGAAPVFVTNAGSAQAIPVVAYQPTGVTENVNVLNSPTVSAQQSGSWNVGVLGSPTVKVSASTVEFFHEGVDLPYGSSKFLGLYDVSAYRQVRIAGWVFGGEITIRVYSMSFEGSLYLLDEFKTVKLETTRVIDMPGTKIYVELIAGDNPTNVVSISGFGRPN